MATTTSSPRLIPERGQVLKRVFKMVLSFLLCSSSSASSTSTKTKRVHSFPADRRS
ncbi:hypothetical protein MtrunA17_Chr8g0375401 [Medicago truncatula]|uniref:Uncharacterized protein n=1 Tax=Medicago truncatula TaxID=3880 RepID=A0A396GMI2_MEDTR|nr:hypothetical protein MtrunA17_Chr8g0375401 [Medicago truncatula]